MAASEGRTWTSGDPWQYMACLPGPSIVKDPFSCTEQSAESHREVDPLFHNEVQGPAQGRGKRPLCPTPAKLGGLGKPPLKRQKKPGTCRFFNKAPAVCPYGRDCMFTHRCSMCGTLEDHGALSCHMQPLPQPEWPPRHPPQ